MKKIYLLVILLSLLIPPRLFAQISTCYEDADQDGFGNPNVTATALNFGCPIGFVSNDSDCDDNDVNAYPRTWYRDADQDGYSDLTDTIICTNPVIHPPIGYTLTPFRNPDGTLIKDCDDHDGFVTGINQEWFFDQDDDGYVASDSRAIVQCNRPGGSNGGQWLSFSEVLGIDCNDNNKLEHPGQKWYIDADGDGYPGSLTPVIQCTRPTGSYFAEDELHIPLILDCDDHLFEVNLSNPIQYKDADNDGYSDGTDTITCNLQPGYKFWNNPNLKATSGDCDDNDNTVWQSKTLYIDNDGDGYDNGTKTLCYGNLPSGYSLTTNGPDCNDNDPNVHSPITYYRDADGDGFGNPSISITACSTIPPPGYVTNNTDCDDTKNDVNPNTQWVLDADNDGYYTGNIIAQCSSPGTGYTPIKLTVGGLTPNELPGDCNDNDPTVHATFSFYADNDHDGFGAGPLIAGVCAVDANTPPPGYSTNNTDCDDNGNAVWQTVTEYIDKDHDGYDAGSRVVCAGLIDPFQLQIAGFSLSTNGPDCDDNNAAVHSTFSFYADNDHDGFGAGPLIAGVCAADANTPPPGYSINNTDCDDNNSAVWRQVIEWTDKDHDGYSVGAGVFTCVGVIDPSALYAAGLSLTSNGSDCNDNDPAVHATFSFYADNDHDGFGAGPLISGVCAVDVNTPPPGYSTNSTDCNDNNAVLNPATVWYKDADNDGYSSGATLTQCLRPTGYKLASELIATSGDCNDNDPGINAGAVEVCNNKVDDNCNGVVDEKSTCFLCQNGTNLTTTNITSTSATFNWSATANPQQWHVQYKTVAPGGQWVDVPLLFGNVRAVTITSPPLLANQTYHWQISAKCNGTWTSYSDAGTFKTAKSGGAISSITATTLNNPTLKLYPNPNKGNFLVELNVLGKINANATIQLIDMTGKTVQMDIARINNGALQKTIHVSPALAEGLYMVRILVNDTVYKTQMIYAK